MRWIALFSHTGSEIINVSRSLGRVPNLIVTNKSPEKVSPEIKQLSEITYVPAKLTSREYQSFLDTDAVVTLHGWMRIVPPDICNRHEIYNLHPGLITRYPELKGKDPQSRVLNGNKTYEHIGCVIHEVTSELDAGRVLMESSTCNDLRTDESIYQKLHGIAHGMWVDFLINKFK